MSLVSSAQVAPTSGSTKRGVQYLVAVQTPQYEIDSLDALDDDAHLDRAATGPQLLVEPRHAVAHRPAPVNITHYNVARDLRRAGQRRRDATSGRSPTAVDEGRRRDRRRRCRAARRVAHQGPGREHGRRRSAGSATGSIFAVVLVYLLMVVNFQSWLDPLIILMALPGRARGHRLDALSVASTTLSVPALMGAIMCVGVATAEQHPGGHLRQRPARTSGATRTTPRSPRA